MEQKKTVLIVDVSLYMRGSIKEVLEEGGYTIVGMATNGEEAIDLGIKLNPDYITLDNILPDMIGLDVLKTYKKEDLPSKIIISAVGQKSTIEEGLQLGALGYLVKPFVPED